jgi:hypothetical protein
LAALVLCAGSLAGPVSAAPAALGCRHLITDPRGNAQMWFLPTKPANPQADLLYVDAAYTRSGVDFSFTMASVQARPSTGTDITVYFTSGQQGPKSHFNVNISHEIDGDSFGVENTDTEQVTDTTGAVDPRAGTISVRVPLRDIHARYGDVLTTLGVIVGQDLGTSEANGGFIEQSTGPRYHYRIGNTNGCRPR